jgi:hypothetical protein
MTDPTEVEVKGKTPGLLRRILWWIWVILLSCLLLAALFFATPWKVITLIAIFLAAATILPRAYRKWFWAGVGVVVLVLIVWVLLPEDNEGWRPYTFDKELAELQAKYAVPDSENAAILYNRILADWKQKEANEPNLPDKWFDKVRKDPWLTKEQPEIAAYLWYHRNTINGVLQAAKFEKCSFPIAATLADFSKDIGRLPPTQQWVYLLIAAGNNALAEGNTNEALEKFLAVLRISRHLSQQPNFTDVLFGMAIESLVLPSINRLVIEGDVDESYLNESEQSVSGIKHDFNTDLTGFIDSDKLMLKNMFGGLFYEVSPKGKVRFSRDSYAKIRKMTKEQLADVNVAEDDFFSGYWFKKLFKAYAILYWFYAPQTPEKLGNIVDTAFEKNYTMTEPDFDWSKEPESVPIESLLQYKLNFRQVGETMARINRGVYFGLHDTYTRHVAQQRGALLIIALRRYKNTHGNWPEILEDINNIAPAEIFVDPTNGDSFVYKRTEDNFTLYSKGNNGIDEQGAGNCETRSKGGADDLMFWSIKSKAPKQQEEDVNDRRQ